MTDKATPPQVPPVAPAAAPPPVRAASSQPASEVAPEHDTTLKWIVPEPSEAPGTPPPKIEFKRERPTPTLPPPPAQAPEPATPASPPAAGRVNVSVDQITRPGAMVSGKVTFSDGNRAEWYFDQTGRLAMASAQPGYRPPAADLQEFQTALDAELSRMGF